MKLSPLGLAILCFVEEFREVGYLDSGGVPTAGYGHTGPEVKVGERYTSAQGEAWLAQDVGRFESAVESLVQVPITQRQFDALVIFTFNIGTRAFAGSSLLSMLNKHDLVNTAVQFMAWDKVHGVPNAGLARRRRLEQAIFVSEFQP